MAFNFADNYKVAGLTVSPEVYAVKVVRLPLENSASGAEVSTQLRSNTLATAKIVGRYERRN